MINFDKPSKNLFFDIFIGFQLKLLHFNCAENLICVQNNFSKKNVKNEHFIR